MSTEQSGGSPPVQMERVAHGKIAVVGASGTGKSYLSKTADLLTCGYINVERKPLPYRQTEAFKFMAQPKTWGAFKNALKDFGGVLDDADKKDAARVAKVEGWQKEIKTIILDSQTMALDLLNREMQANFTGWDIAKYYNRQVAEYLEIMKSIQKDMIIISHDEYVKLDDKSAAKRMVVHNKEYEGKLERQYTTVLYTDSRFKDGKPSYLLRTFEPGASAKTPEGLFPDKDGNNLLEIPNDAGYIFKCIEAYYSVPVRK